MAHIALELVVCLMAIHDIVRRCIVHYLIGRLRWLRLLSFIMMVVLVVRNLVRSGIIVITWTVESICRLYRWIVIMAGTGYRRSMTALVTRGRGGRQN